MINLLLFFDDKNLKRHMQSFEDDYIVVTPSPVHADMARLFFDSQRNFDVITISNFIKTYTESIFDDDFELKLKRKSELNLILASLWKIMNKDASFELFQKSFNLLTDFRAFSLNEDILSTILENYNEQISNSVLWFHRTLENLGFVDEHKSYFIISEKLREGNLPILLENEKNIIFMGFDFLTPAQIDMVQALAIRNNIYIPFSKKVFDKSKDFDWIKWITKFDTKIETIDEKDEEQSSLKTIEISKNYLSKALKLLELNNDDRVVISSKNLDQKMIGEIPYSDIKFKVPIDLLYKESSLIEEELMSFTSAEAIEKAQFKSWITDKKDMATGKQDFKTLKSVMLLMDIFLEWESLSEQNTHISSFEAKVFIESLKLNSPRNSIINSRQTQIHLESLNSLDKIDGDHPTYFCASAEYGPIKSSVIDYSEDVQKYLATIGPIRRSEFEFEILKSKLVNKLKMKNSKLVIEKSLITEDAGWSEILSEFELDNISLDIYNKRESLFDYFENKNVSHSITNYSASRLQTYLDCPQKYWLNYILKQSKRVVLPQEMSPLELGLLEHRIIELYLSRYSHYDEEILDELIKLEINKVDKEISDEITLQNILIELKSYTKNIILELVDLKAKFNLKYTFEKDIKNSFNNAIGSIDCYAESNDFNLILDFKRGGASIPTNKGLFEFDKLQLWFYLNQVSLANPDFIKKDFLWGYVNLGELDKSLIYASSKDLKTSVLSKESKLLAKINVLKDDFLDELEKYKALESETLNSLKSEEKFLASPRKDTVCNFCDLKNICTR